MPPPPTPLQSAIILLILCIFASMLAALFRLGLQVRRGEALLPGAFTRARIVPWGWRSVVLLLVIWVSVNIRAVEGYARARARYGIHLGPRETVSANENDRLPAKGPKIGTTKGLGKAERTKAPRPTKASGTPKLNFTEQMFLVSVINAILILLFPVVLRLTSGARLRDLGLTPVDPRVHVPIGFRAFLVVTPVVMAINLLALLIWSPNRHPLEGMLREGLTPGGIVLAYLSAAVLAPLAEELMFRGIIQGWLRRIELNASIRQSTVSSSPSEQLADALLPPPPESSPQGTSLLGPVPLLQASRPSRKRGRSPLPIVLTSIFFAVVHAPQMPAPFAIFFLSLALGWLYEATGSLWPSVVLHAAFNGFNTTLMVLSLTTLAPTHDPVKDAKEPARPAGKVGEKHTFRLPRDAPPGKFLVGFRGGRDVTRG